MAELQTQEHKENCVTNECSAQKPGGMMEETGKDLRGNTALFLLNFNGQAVGAVKSHFNTGEETHQQQGEDKEYYRFPVDH